MTETILARTEATQFQPEALQPHPRNPRGKVGKAEVADLARSIEEVGQLQPGLVRPVGPDGPGGAAGRRYEIVIGHRRAKACEVAGRSFLAFTAKMDDATALAVMLLDNESAEAPDPLKEADGIAGLLSCPGWTVEKVSAYFGKSPSWVASRSNLRRLEPEVRKVLAELGWPVDWMEEVAKVLGPSQKEAVERLRWVSSRAQLERELRPFLSVLGTAPWDLDDGGLVRAAGSCRLCPKQSGSEPGLFPGLKEKDLRKAVCRDRVCWSAKEAASFERTLAEARSKKPEAKLVLAYGTKPEDLPETEHPLPVAGGEGTVDASKKGAKGAELGLLVDRPRGKVTPFWYKPRRERVDSGGRPKKKRLADMKPAEKRKAQEAKLEERRAVELCARWSVSLSRQKSMADSLKLRSLWGLALAYGLGEDHGARLEDRKTNYELVTERDGDHESELKRELWERVSPLLAAPMSFPGLKAAAEAEWQAEALGWSKEFEVLRKAVEEDLPEPKGWAKEAGKK